ncbi:MAG: CHAT domain-containing protein [Cyanobacteria bacterium P01_F01_bin.86]
MNFNRKHQLHAIIACLGVLFFPPGNWHSWAQSSTPEQLNQDGFSLLHQGAAAEALAVWQRAEQQYRQIGDPTGITGTQLNQALAQQALGLYPRACLTVTQALALTETICQPMQGQEAVSTALSGLEATEVNSIGVRLLGESLRLLGNLEEAQAALSFAQTTLVSSEAETEQVTLALGNVHQLLAKEAIQDYSRVSVREIKTRSEILERINQASRQAIAYYQTVMGSEDGALQTKAQLNLIGLFAALEKQANQQETMAALPALAELSTAAQRAYAGLGPAAFEQMPQIEDIYGRLNLASHLLTVQVTEAPKKLGRSQPFTDIEALISTATAEAEAIQNQRAIAFAYGVAGDFQAQQGLATNAVIEQYAQALAIARSVQAEDISFRLAYKLAKQHESVGQQDIAAEYYDQAIADLAAVRENLIAVNSELRFNFKEEVEPVYRDYIRALATGGAVDLVKATTVHQSLQLAQLENFLRCGRLIAPSASDAGTTTLNVINLGDVFQVIVSQAGKFADYQVPAENVLPAIDNLKVNLQSPAFASVPETDFLPYAQALHKALIEPAQEKGWLTEGAPLRFVLDAPLQAIPMGILHDGQQYLVASHPLSLSVQSQAMESSTGKGTALFAGLSEAAPSFAAPQSLQNSSPLPETEFEATAVDGFARTSTLLNDHFTLERFGEKMAESNYEVIHISTHGQFSSVPEKTFLLAWDEQIDFFELSEIFQQSGQPDLLFLSACQTAAGDDRSVLGLAGLAVQSGANSAIASLWLQDSTGSSVLVDQFYQALANEGLSKADALQQAQIVLMESTAFSHPYYWAPFVLVGR